MHFNSSLYLIQFLSYEFRKKLIYFKNAPEWPQFSSKSAHISLTTEAIGSIFFSFYSCLKDLSNAEIQTVLSIIVLKQSTCVFLEKKCDFFQIFYLFTYKKYNFKNRSLKFGRDTIFDKYKNLLKFHKDNFFSIGVMNFFKKFFSVKNQNLTKNGHIDSFLNETVKDIKFWFSATIRILYKLKVKKKNSQISLSFIEIC